MLTFYYHENFNLKIFIKLHMLESDSMERDMHCTHKSHVQRNIAECKVHLILESIYWRNSM